MATIVFTCGAEATSEPDHTAHWTSGSGTYSRDTTHVRSGTYAWKFPVGGVYLGKTIASPTQHLVGRVSVYLSAVPPDAGFNSRLFDWSDGQWRSCEVASDGYAYFGQKDAEGIAGGVQSTSTIPIGEWVDIDFWSDSSANTHYHYWSINGVPQTTHSEDMGGTNNFGGFDLIGSVARVDTWIDDVALSKTAADYPISDGSVSGTATEVWTDAATGPVWTTPADTVGMTTTPELKFTIPDEAVAQHFWLELDTADTFDTGNLRIYRSDLVQTNWAFWDGDSWEPIPAGGVAAAYVGEEMRYTVTDALTATTWYRRVRARI